MNFKRFSSLGAVMAIIGLMALLAFTPTISQGGTFHADQQQGSGEPLGCQRNNPDRLDCSSLEVTGICEADIAVFTIRNTGEAGNGDMRAPTQYRLIVDGVVVETGTIQLAGGATMQITYSGGGSVRLEADQQVGHPGSSHPRTTLECGGSTQPTPTDPTPTEPTPTEPTPTEPTPTEPTPTEPTPTEPTPTQPTPTEPTPTEPTPTEPTPAPGLTGEVMCDVESGIWFTITNNGETMAQEEYYYVYDADGNTVTEGYLFLFGGETTYINVPGDYTVLSLMVGNNLLYLSVACGGGEPVPPSIVVDPVCVDGTSYFVITNVGGDMNNSLYYTVVDSVGYTVTTGYLELHAGESLTIDTYGYNAPFSLDINYGEIAVTYECPTEPTPTPTEPIPTEPTPTEPTPTEPTPTEPTPTEPTPTTPAPTTPAPTTPAPTTPAPTTPAPTPTPTEPTPLPILGCQRNNPSRLDCSSLQVTATCQGNTAIFIITNTGEPGNGDMRAATDYRLIVGGRVIEIGDVLLAGGASMTVQYSAGGRVTLEADQQVGHPGRSQPQATLKCGK